MKIYLVGGAVRDELMGVPSKDRDYVVVGSTHEEMIARGFTKVGAAFPVYLDPVTKEEYALARTEKSTGPGYHDFEVVFGPDVTIEQDLARRDLTINAIAKDLETGEYIDPFGGIKHIKQKSLRCVSETSFKEDPLRIYRLARFYARYGDEFTIHHYTRGACFQSYAQLKYLPKDRKWAEIKKCFSDHSEKNKPSLMFRFLIGLGEFPELFELHMVEQPKKHHPEGDALVHTFLCLDYAQKIKSSPEVKWAVLCHDLGKCMYWKNGNLHGHESYGVPIVKEMSERVGVPNSWKNLAMVVAEEHTRMHRIKEMKPSSVYDLIYRLRGEKDQEFFGKFAEACLCDARGRGEEKMFERYDSVEVLYSALAGITQNSVAISKGSKKIADDFKGRPEVIRSKVRDLKIGYVKKALAEVKLKLKEGTGE
jgi:tRNA nucleotidyltransferase (CCA-adding enzyme)